MTNTEREANLTCAERVAGHWQNTRDDLQVLYAIQGCEHVDQFLSDQGYSFDEFGLTPEKTEALDEIRASYPLGFDYVEPDTFIDQPEGYFRYQISWGGPSDEIRFYVNLDGSCHRAEYWFLDWGDGARLDVTSDEVARAVFEDFSEMGMIKLPE